MISDLGRETFAATVDAAAIVRAAADADRDAVAQLVAPLDLAPNDPMTGEGLLLDGVDLVARLIGVQCLVMHMRVRGDVRFAGELALRLVDALVEHGLLGPGRNPGERMMAANVIDSCASCLADAGRGGDLLLLAPAWSVWLDEVDLSAQWRSLQHARAEAALHAGRYQIGADLLAELGRRFSDSPSHPIEQRLRDKLDDLYRAVDRADKQSMGLAWMLERSLALIAGTNIPVGTGSDVGPDLDGLVTEMRSRIGLSSPPKDIPGLAAAVARLPRAHHPFDHVSGIVAAFGAVLGTESVLARDDYIEIANLAEAARALARDFGFWHEATTLAWIASVALRRAGELVRAADLLADIRADIRERQLGITDPRLRAALSVYLPHLAGVSSKVLYDLGPAKAEELFLTLEESKARILGDLIAARMGAGAVPTAGAMRRFLEGDEIPAAYLTLLCDTDETYAALQTRRGSPHVARLRMGRSAIAAAARRLALLFDGDPSSLTGGAGIDPDAPWASDPRPILEVLRPLGNWLATLFDAGVLHPAEVVCISPDGPLYNLPLLALDVAGKPLVEYAAITITPSAAILVRAAESRGRRARTRGVAMVVPRSTEFDNDPPYDRALYRRDADELAASRPTTIVPGVECDVGGLLNAELSDSFVHLAGHGEFNFAAPLDHSGLALAFGGRLPPGVGKLPREALFTPRDAETLRARGAHVTLRACVSGRATEVTSREALGMVWALFQSGASSIAAASWHADVRSLSVLLTEFYRCADTRRPVAHAHREAILALRDVSDAFGHPYHYAALNLYGFWR